MSSPDKETSPSNTTAKPLDMAQQATTASETTIQQPVNENSSHSNPDLSTQTTEQKQLDGRAELIARARSFLVSPQVQLQDTAAKRSFLAEKGLNEAEIEELLRNLPLQVPSIPPRTYPQPPPSNLPVLLLGLARLFSWLAGGSAVILFLFQRFLLPRITQTTLARRSIKSHQLSLMRQLNASISTTKESLSESFSVLPKPDLYKEPENYAQCITVPDTIKAIEAKEIDMSQMPQITLLRCAISDMIKSKGREDAYPTTEITFSYLESQIPWLTSEEGVDFENKLWETLSTCPLFEKSSSGATSDSPTHDPDSSTSPTLWKYVPPPAADTPPLLKSLENLSSALPKDIKTRKSPLQHTLQAMSDFTGYISTQVYLPYRSPSSGMLGISSSTGLSSVEEDLKKEIRALKGLVLNRRSFMPSLSRTHTSSAMATS